MSKYGKNRKVARDPFLPYFDVSCDLLLNIHYLCILLPIDQTVSLRTIYNASITQHTV